MFGSHLSIAGGLENALIQAQDYAMDCVQIFTKNQRQWRVPALTDEQVQRWQDHREQTGIREVVSHDSYLINLASPKTETRDKSIDLFREELVRCDRLEIPYLVTHPGSHMKEGEEPGLKRVAEALDQLHEELPNLSVTTCLEVTAGQGTQLGYRFQHLARLIELVEQSERLGVCLDTAHMLAAGYDLTDEKGTRRALRELDQTVGLDRVHCIHMNDSKVECNRRVDRHAHIGHGYVSQDAFSVLINHTRLKKVPKILETAKGEAPDGRPWDVVNLEALQSLQRARTGKKTGSGRKKTAKTRKNA
jgi:deoxyribonuclease-4